jgi:transposase InsO family protein
MFLIREAVSRGARTFKACETIDLSMRTLQRWKRSPLKCDQRKGPKVYRHALSKAEKDLILEICNEESYRNLSPSQIVPKLADQGIYIASERSFYRVLNENRLNIHRGKSKAKKNKKPLAIVANNPLEVWSWDITYLKSPVKGIYYYLYLVMDVYSRMIVGWEVQEEQTSEISSKMMKRICKEHEIEKESLILHSDNGGPMKGATMICTLQSLGVMPSFNRPSVSSDNAYSESLFKTLKYRPGYPKNGFESLEDANLWVANFIHWYNFEHLHSEIKFVTPYSRHTGEDQEILAKRREVYKKAKEKNEVRWFLGKTRNWDKPLKVGLNDPNLRKGIQTVMVEAA